MLEVVEELVESKSLLKLLFRFKSLLKLLLSSITVCIIRVLLLVAYY